MSNLSKKHRIYPYFERGRFYNYKGEKKPNFLLPSVAMLLEWYLCKSHEKKVDVSNWIELMLPIQRSHELAITWIGHSTFLIQVAGINILTDPIFGDLSVLFPRILPPGIELKKLPEIDFVLLSHNHRDHMDDYTLNILKMHKKITYLVPKGDKAWFDKRGFKNVIESMWWDKHAFCPDSNFANSINFTFLPAFHWSQRGLLDYNKSLWGSWMITAQNISIYFAGDTGYGPHFRSIAQEFPSIDVAIMPIGPCEPRQWMKDAHISAEEAVEAFIELNAKSLIPMHWGTYYFGVDRFDLPSERLIKYWQRQNFNLLKELHILKVGQRQVFDSTQFGIFTEKPKDIGLTI